MRIRSELSPHTLAAVQGPKAVVKRVPPKGKFLSKHLFTSENPDIAADAVFEVMI